MPSPKSLISRELPENQENRKNVLDKAKETLKKVKAEMQNDLDKTLEEILQKLQISSEQYERHLQVAHRSSRIILKRKTNECRVNAYNHDLLQIWKANMDIQYIEDAVSAVMYVCGYMMKSEKGMVELLRQSAEKCKRKTKSQLKTIGRAFLGSQEVSAQEEQWISCHFL